MNYYTTKEQRLIKRLWKAADDEGIIQAWDMLKIAPHERPELHTTMSVVVAFKALTGKVYLDEDEEVQCDLLPLSVVVYLSIHFIKKTAGGRRNKSLAGLTAGGVLVLFRFEFGPFRHNIAFRDIRKLGGFPAVKQISHEFVPALNLLRGQ